MSLRLTFLSEGTSDSALLPILDEIARAAAVSAETVWADVRRYVPAPSSLSARIGVAAELYPCDLLVVHRDADGAGRDRRLVEIEEAARTAVLAAPVVPLVPVRAMESWLLVSETAVRRAAGNPDGRIPLALPTPREAERLADPKALLLETLRTASGTAGRKRRKFDVYRARRLVASYLAREGLGSLRRLESFAFFEDRLREALVLGDQG